jgi:hypothetical protein
VVARNNESKQLQITVRDASGGGLGMGGREIGHAFLDYTATQAARGQP